MKNQKKNYYFKFGILTMKSSQKNTFSLNLNKLLLTIQVSSGMRLELAKAAVYSLQIKVEHFLKFKFGEIVIIFQWFVS